MTAVDERLRAADPSREVTPPEHVLTAILAAPAPAQPRRRPRVPGRMLAGAIALAACAALALGITLPGDGDHGPSFVARAYAQTAPVPATDQIVHVVERTVSQVGGVHQVDVIETWQRGGRWHRTLRSTETGTRVFSDTEEQLFDGKVIRSWFTKAPPQTRRGTTADRESWLARFRAAYRGQQLTDLGIVTFAGRRAHAFRTTAVRVGTGRSVAAGIVATYFFDPKTALPAGSTLTARRLRVTRVVTVREELAPTRENLRKVTGRS